jgi:hypothetical protein
MKQHESDNGAESSIRIDILASLRNQFVSRDSATTCAQQDCKGHTARTEDIINSIRPKRNLMKQHESDNGAESSIRIDILASLRNQFVSRDSATTCAQQDCKGDTARTEKVPYTKLT